jgi:hypothetical protein
MKPPSDGRALIRVKNRESERPPVAARVSAVVEIRAVTHEADVGRDHSKTSRTFTRDDVLRPSYCASLHRTETGATDHANDRASPPADGTAPMVAESAIR